MKRRRTPSTPGQLTFSAEVIDSKPEPVSTARAAVLFAELRAKLEPADSHQKRETISQVRC